MDKSSLAKKWIDTFLTSLAPFVWGSTYIVTTELLPPDRPFLAATIRVLPAGFLLVLFSRYLPKPQQWIRLSLLSANSVWDTWGLIAAFLGTISMALGTYLTRRWQVTIPVLAFTGWQLLIGGLMLVPVAIYVDSPLLSLTLPQALGYAYLCLFGALLAYVLWFRGVMRLSPVAVSSLGLLSPLTAVILGWLILGQSMTAYSLLGLLLVISSVFMVQWTTKR